MDTTSSFTQKSEASAPKNQRLPYPSPSFYSDFPALKLMKEDIRRVSLLSLERPKGFTSYTAFLFERVVDEGKPGERKEVIIARAGPEAAPEGRAAAKYMAPDLINKIWQSTIGLFAKAAKEIVKPYNYGLIVGTMDVLPTIKERTKDTVMETDGESKVLGGWDIKSYVQGTGLDGIVPNPRMQVSLLTDDPAKAQRLFMKTIQTEEELNSLGVRYANLPKDNSGTANSNTLTSIAAERAGLGQKFGEMTGLIVPGTARSFILKGPASIREIRDHVEEAARKFLEKPFRTMKHSDRKDLSAPVLHNIPH